MELPGGTAAIYLRGGAGLTNLGLYTKPSTKRNHALYHSDLCATFSRFTVIKLFYVGCL